MALSGTVQDIIQSSGVSNGYEGGYSNSGYSDSGSGYNSVGSNYKETAKSTAPLADYNPYADGAPQSVIDAENELNHRSIPNQEYAQQVQDTIIRDNLGYLSDPNYKGTYSALEASQAFEYLSRANEGASYSNWAAPKADDQLFTEIVPQWDAARNIRAKATEQYNAPLPTAEQSIIKSVYNNPQLNTAQREVLNADQIQRGDWRTMSWIDRLKALAVPSSNLEDTIENAPDWAKYVQNIFPSLMASGAGAAVGSLFGPVGTAIGATVVGGLSYLQGVTKVQIPVINELLYGMDILSVWAEQGQGAIGATLKETWDRSMADGSTDLWELGKTMGDVLKDFPDLWEVGQLSYEVGADLGFDNIFNAGRNLVAGASDALFGTDFGQVDTNTVSRANLGIGGLVETNPETRGYDSLTHVYMPLYRTIRDEAVRQGMDYSEAKAFAVNHLSELLTNYMGTTGQANDFGASSIFDPLNFLPTIEAEVADSIGKRTNDTALQNAAKAAKEGASPIVDAFSVPLIQPIAEFITGKHATQGMDTILNTYAKELQTKVPVKDLTTLQKRIAGIDNNGMIKNYNHESNVVKRWLGTTEEAKLYSMSENVANMLGSIFFDTELNPEIIPEMISEFVGISPITPDGPLSAFADSALLKTMQSTMKDITIKDIQDIQKSVDSFRSLNTNRVAVDTVADKLHMKIGDIFDALDDPKKSAELKQKILKENITLTDERTKITWSPEEVYNKIDAFSQSNVGRGQYSMDLFKVQIMDKISQKSQNALLDRYNIKPDAWQNRLFDLMKSTQSITLLNYSPSYFINNALNNIITRSAVGVGGFDTKSIKTSNEKRGLHSSRDSQIYTDAQNKIGAKKTKDDLIGKVKTKWEDITGTDKVSGKILKGFNNIDIESLEKRAAFDIGANRYWEATWKPGLNIPEIPSQLVALGFTPEMNETIYKLAMDSNTLSEFKQKLAGDVILPGASSTLGQMIGKNYSQTAQPLIRNLIDSMPWIREAVDDLLATGNPETIRQGFQTIIDKVSHDIDIENVVQLSSDFNNLVTQIAGSGFTEFINSKMAVDDLYNDIWINQSTESEMLFAQRIAAARIPEDQFRPEYEAMLSRRNADYAMVRKYDVNHLAATIVGLGLKDDIAKTLILNKLQQYDNMQKYVTEEHNLFMKFADRTSPDYDYAYYAQSKLDMLQKVQNMQLDSYRQFDEVIVQYLRDNLDKSYTEMINKYEKDCADIQRYRAELNAKEIEWLQARMNEPDLYERHKISEEQNSERNILKNNIMGQMFDANRNLEILADGFEKPKNKGQINLTLEQTLWLELLYREANETVANSGEFLSHYIDKSDPKTVFEPSDFSNTNVKESFVEYGKRTQSPENIEAMRKVYESGDAVPLGAVDVKNVRMADEVMGTDYKPVDTSNPVPASETAPVSVPEPVSEVIPEPVQTVQRNPVPENIVTNTYEPIEHGDYEKLQNKEYQSQLLSDMSGKYTAEDNSNYQRQYESGFPVPFNSVDFKNVEIPYFDESNLQGSIEKNIAPTINANPDEKYSVMRCNPFMLNDEIVYAGVYDDGKLIAYKTENLRDTLFLGDEERTLHVPVLGYDVNNQDQVLVIASDRVVPLDKSLIDLYNDQAENTLYLESVLNIPDSAAEIQDIPETLNIDTAPKPVVEAPKTDTSTKKFDSYEQYAAWMEKNGNKLTEDNDFIPEKYQSEKYLSNLKETILRANSERIRLEAELEKHLRQLDFAERRGSVEGNYATKERKAVGRLRLAIQSNEKQLLKQLGKDDYYRLWLDNSTNRKNDDRKRNKYGRVLNEDNPRAGIIADLRELSDISKLDYSKLLRDVETNAKFNPEAKTDNRPGSAGEYVKPAQTEKPSISINEKLDQLYSERQVLITEKNRLLRLEKNAEKEVKKKNSTIEKHDRDVRQLQRIQADIQHNNQLLDKVDNQIREINNSNSYQNLPVDQPVSQPEVTQILPSEYGKAREELVQTADKIIDSLIDRINDQNKLDSAKFTESLSGIDVADDSAALERQYVPDEAKLRQAIPELFEENPTPVQQIPVVQPEVQNIPQQTVNPVENAPVTQPEPQKTVSPKSTNQKIDNYILSGIKKIIDNNKTDNPKLEKISAQDLKNITNSIKVEVYNKTGNNIDTSEQTGWADVLKNYVDDASAEKINSAVSNFIDQATRFKQQNSTSVDAKREFTPYKANWQKSDANLSMVRTQPFYYNDQLVKAGVVHNGEIIAYITTTMPDTISVGGYTFPVIGVDTFDPNALWLYVKDEPVKVTPGKPNGVDYSVFAENGEHPMRFGTTPTTEPWGTAAWETSLPLREALNLWRDEALEQLQTNLNNGSFFGKLTPEQQKALYSWVDGKLQSAYNYQRFAANRYGDTMVDLSMLNYNDRHGFDNTLTALMPYQYWITRSVMNWGRRMIDQPKWFSMYARLEKLIEKNKRDFLPSRLEGMVGIPLPFMPKGLGQGLYFNPFDIQLPFKQFYNFSEYFDRNLHTIHKNTISVIEEHYREGRPYNGHIITKQEYDDAMLGKGNLYNQVFWDQRNSDETNTGLSGLVSSYFNPNVLVSSLWKAIESKSSHGKDLSYSPMYKLGNTLRASARDTAAEGIFGILADVLQMPDKTWRKVLNAESDPIGSSWTDYWTVKYLTDMLYSKEHSYNEVFNAIAEGENNPLWQEARNRYSTSEAYKQQGGAILNEVMQSIAGNKPTSFGNIAGTALTSIFGGRTYTSGEEDYRRMQDLYYNVKNDPGMYDEFWKQLPEYKVGGYAYKIDNREDLLHTMLVDNCSNAYYALPKDQQQAVYNGLGKQFQQLFIDKETRAPDQIDNRTLIEWTRAMQGNVPNIADATLYQPMQDAFTIQWYSDSLQGLIDRFNRDKKQRYPGIDTIEQGYYNTQLKDQYLAIHPELREYWNWKESAGMANPQLGAYHARQTAENKVNSGKYNDITEAIKSQVNNYSRTCLDNHIKKGWSLPASVEHQLKVAYTNLGVNIPFETWLKEIQW